MSTLLQLARVLVSGISALVVTVLVEYLFMELLMFWYMRHLGINNRAELSEDYGGAFFLIVVMVIVFLVAFPFAYTALWRFSKRLVPTTST